MNARIQKGYVLFLREWYRIKKNILNDCINYIVLWPVIFSITSGYFVPLTYFGVDKKKATVLFAGLLLLQLMIKAYGQAFYFLIERSDGKIIQYQIAATSSFSVFFVRIIFGIFYTAFLLIPFFPVSKLILGNYFYTDQLSWGLLLLVIIIGASLSVTYTGFLFVFIKKLPQVENVWMRTIEPLLWVGGLWVPWGAMYKAVPVVGWISLLNPFLYFTEAIRQLLFRESFYFSLSLCFVVMAGAAIVFFLCAYYLFKKRLDIL